MKIIELNNVAVRFNLLLPAALVSGISVYKLKFAFTNLLSGRHQDMPRAMVHFH